MNAKGSEVVIKGISKNFGAFKALDSVNLEVKKGEFFSLLGPSGCGKTTLLRIIAGFEDPTAGQVFIDGKDVVNTPPDKRHVNTVFQSYALFPHLSIFENIAFPLRLKKIQNKVVREKVGEYLNLVQLVGHEDKKPAQLSGGQKQRVAIARALINEPDVLLLDEPLSALDAKLRQHMLIELDSIHDKIGITFIYVTHDQHEALSVSDRVAVFNQGHVLQIDTPFTIYEEPADMFTAKFIGENNLMHGRVVSLGDEHAIIETETVGKMFAEKNELISIGSEVDFMVRPEKIRITREKPKNLPEGFNVLPGVVDEVIYNGFQSKYFVRIEGRPTPFLINKQHVNYSSEESEMIAWKDPVHIWWDDKDSFILEEQTT